LFFVLKNSDYTQPILCYILLLYTFAFLLKTVHSPSIITFAKDDLIHGLKAF